MDKHKAAFSPASRVPSDVWFEIFYRCIPLHWQTLEQLPSDPLSAFLPQNAPTLLLRVCRSWAVIVFSYPKLWSIITLRPSHPKWRPIAASLVHTWLRRSQNAPLTILLVSEEPRAEAGPLLGAPAIRALFAQSHRWKSAAIALLPSSAEIFSLLRRSDLHMLQDMELIFLRHGSSHFPTLLVENAPNLRRVKYWGISPPPAAINRALGQLTDFSNQVSEGGTLDTFLSLLKSAPALQNVEWCCKASGRNSGSDQDSSSTVQHSCLQFLSIALHERPSPSFDQLSLPGLQSLTIVQRNKCWSWLPSEQFFLQCSSLKHLTLDTVGIEHLYHAELVNNLKLLTSLTHFTLDNSSLTLQSDGRANTIDYLLQSLRYHTSEEDDAKPILLPALASLVITCAEASVTDINVSVSRYLNMVESRWRPFVASYEGHAILAIPYKFSRLESASLTINRSRWPVPVGTGATVDQQGPRLRKLKSEGLDVNLLIHEHPQRRYRN